MAAHILVVSGLLLLLVASPARIVLAGPPVTSEVSADGALVPSSSALTVTSPGGGYQGRIQPVQVGFDQFRVDLDVTSADGVTHRLAGLQGNGFLLSDRGRVVVLATAESNALPSALRIYDLNGTRLWEGTLDAPVNPTLSLDGRYLACGVRGATVVLDLESFTAARHPQLDLFVVGAGGLLAGISYHDDDALFLHGNGEATQRVELGFRARKLGFSPDQRSLLVLGPTTLVRVAVAAEARGDRTSRAETLYRAAAGSDLRDLHVTASGFDLGLRRSDGLTTQGERVRLDTVGRLLQQVPGPSRTVLQGTIRTADSQGIPWPLTPDAQHPVGATYGEYQRFGGAGGTAYPHPGVDVVGYPFQEVYAVRGGVVKAILTTSDKYHWRVAVADGATSGTSRGYLYAHLGESSITVNVGDVVTAGQQLGTLVQWPAPGYSHCHLARIEASGATWDGHWLSVQNPHLDLSRTETSAPVFLPARGTNLLAFCTNETSDYQSPTALQGDVDIIARVYDQVDATWKCAVQELRYTIYPLGDPGSPLVNDRQSVFFNMPLDTYADGTSDAFLVDLLYKQDAVCASQGDFSYQDFYHILTNSDGDEVYEASDLYEAWNTAILPDGDYVIRVRAVDAAGNAAVDSMVVTTANGNSAPICLPNPAVDRAAVCFSLPSPGRVTVSVYGPDGRLVRTIFSGSLATGLAARVWDLRDARGQRVPAGAYFYRITAADRAWSGKVIVIR
jgi:murein DD-endopeptidase MepM/ murein hydrolase activator NlpD